jgi:hypothetical protein
LHREHQQTASGYKLAAHRHPELLSTVLRRSIPIETNLARNFVQTS